MRRAQQRERILQDILKWRILVLVRLLVVVDHPFVARLRKQRRAVHCRAENVLHQLRAHLNLRFVVHVLRHERIHAETLGLGEICGEGHLWQCGMVFFSGVLGRKHRDFGIAVGHSAGARDGGIRRVCRAAVQNHHRLSEMVCQQLGVLQAECFLQNIARKLGDFTIGVHCEHEEPIEQEAFPLEEVLQKQLREQNQRVFAHKTVCVLQALGHCVDVTIHEVGVADAHVAQHQQRIRAHGRRSGAGVRVRAQC